MKPWELSEDGIEQALQQACGICGAPEGAECVTVVRGTPLVDETGYYVHGWRTKEVG